MRTIYAYPELGLYVSEQMSRYLITERFYKYELSAGSRSYGSIKKGGDLRLSYYIRFIDLLFDLAGEEEFRLLVLEALELYILARKKRQMANNRNYQETE